MKIQTVLLISFFSISTAFGQTKQDVVYLKNEGIIRGKIIEQNSERIKIESIGRNVYVFSRQDISEIKSEPVITDYPLKNFGYFNFTSIGTVFGSALNDKPAPFSLLMEHNFRINQYFAFGAVTGLEMLNEMVAPVGGNLKLLLPQNNGNTFYWGISGGYSISLEKPEYLDYYVEIEEAYGGTMFNSEAGAVFPMRKNISLFIAAGYRYNELHYKRQDSWYTSVGRSMYFNRVSLKVGLAFH